MLIMESNIIALMEFGSHLYGTDTVSSDQDYKGIYLPSNKECALGQIKKSITQNSNNSNIKNSKDDVDKEIYSLQYFILTLGKNGDTTFLDMIHAPDKNVHVTSDILRYLRKNRHKFYTKNLKSYIGYCRGQAAKYGIRGSKLKDAEKILNILNSKDDSVKLSEFWDELPDSEYVKRYDVDKCQSEDKRCYDFCGKKLMATTNVFYTKKTIQGFYDGYGERARLAKLNQGIDWKAIHHAFRVGYQLQGLYTTGDLIFPLQDRKYLKEIKAGEYHYLNDGIAEKLESLIEEVEILANKSNFPEKVDLTEWEDYICEIYK